MREPSAWRWACVRRAVTMADGARLIELSVEADGSRRAAGSLVALEAENGARGGIHRILPSAQDGLRIAVRGVDSAEARFMWRLIEGARLRLLEFAGGLPGETAVAMRGVPIRLACPSRPRDRTNLRVAR